MTKKKYKVTFEFLNTAGEWRTDYLNNNGVGFTFSDAEHVANQLRQNGNVNVNVEEN